MMLNFLCRCSKAVIKPNQSIHKTCRSEGLGELSVTGSKGKSEASINQDAFISYVSEHESGRSSFAVFDGHGSEGHLVSQFCRSRILELLESQKFNVVKAFEILQSELEQCNDPNYTHTKSIINAECSGTTCTLIQIENGILYCSNVGDSKALLATRNSNNQLECLELTFDHKPENESERLRVMKEGGRVYSTTSSKESDDVKMPIRVWYNTKNGTQMGLAMTRSIGDLSAHKAGVSCLPYEIEKKLEEDDEFVILGSDGLFDVMKNDEILTIINDYMATLPPDEHRYAWKPQEVAKLLVATARSRWIKYSDYIDDITCCIVKLKDHKRHFYRSSK